MTQELVTEGTRVTAAFVARHGMHPTDVQALTRVLRAQEQADPMTAGALARALGLTSGSVTAVVDRLERAGHVRRVRDPQDRRKVLLESTPAGSALADSFTAPVEARSHAVMDDFGPAELAVVRRFLAATGRALAEHGAFLAGGVDGGDPGSATP
nr:MarR family transcriptional regulator [Kineococcus siccus]